MTIPSKIKGKLHVLKYYQCWYKLHKDIGFVFKVFGHFIMRFHSTIHPMHLELLIKRTFGGNGAVCIVI